MANTTTSNTTGLLGLVGQAAASPSYYNQLAAQQSLLYQMQLQNMQYATPAPVDFEKEITVPIIDSRDRKGLFLRDKDGNLMHVSAERLYKALGFEW